MATSQGLDFRNLVTLFRDRKDIAQGWYSFGYEPVWADMATRSMTLDQTSNAEWLPHYDTPFPFYVDLGQDFALVPSMSALLNPFVGMVRHLRGNYGGDWDRCLDRREDLLRKQIASLLPRPRFEVPPSGFKLKRSNGSALTDIDAAIVDNLHGTVALVQIKWYDVFSRSLRERDSRRRNMLGASSWIDKVHGWIADRNSGAVATALGLKHPSGVPDGPPVLVVMTRHAARFSGEASADRRSAWLSWPEFARTVQASAPDADVLRIVAAQHTPSEHSIVSASSAPSAPTAEYHFDGVEIKVIHAGC